MAASLILDAANLHFSALDAPISRQVETTFKAGVLALNRVHRFFDHTAETKPAELRLPDEQAAAPSRQAFADSWRALGAAGLPLRPSEEEAWQHYQERRRRYAPALDFLNELLMTPPLER
jgi:hypothetical protein